MEEVSELLGALYRGDRDAVGRLRAGGGALDVFEAAALGALPRLVELLDEDPSRAGTWAPDGFTALHLTAFFDGDADCARALLDAGADPRAPARNAMAVTPLGSAAARGNVAVATELLAEGALVSDPQRGGYTPLHSAAANGDAALVELLLEHGADPGLPAEDGRLPADLADERGHPRLAERLRRSRPSP